MTVEVKRFNMCIIEIMNYNNASKFLILLTCCLFSQENIDLDFLIKRLKEY